MKFEEEFPSLKEEVWSLTQLRSAGGLDGDKELIFIPQIEKHCLDKARILEAIKKLISKNEGEEPCPDAETCGYSCGLKDLLKELKLEEKE